MLWGRVHGMNPHAYTRKQVKCINLSGLVFHASFLLYSAKLSICRWMQGQTDCTTNVILSIIIIMVGKKIESWTPIHFERHLRWTLYDVFLEWTWLVFHRTFCCTLQSRVPLWPLRGSRKQKNDILNLRSMARLKLSCTNFSKCCCLVKFNERAIAYTCIVYFWWITKNGNIKHL